MDQNTQEELFFFSQMPDALAIYAPLRALILETLPKAQIEVRKTQISFKAQRLVAAVSFLPVRRAAERPKVFLTLTLGFRERLLSPRVDQAAEISAHRWTHHLMLTGPDEVDGELRELILLSSLTGRKER